MAPGAGRPVGGTAPVRLSPVDRRRRVRRWRWSSRGDAVAVSPILPPGGRPLGTLCGTVRSKSGSVSASRRATMSAISRSDALSTPRNGPESRSRATRVPGMSSPSSPTSGTGPRHSGSPSARGRSTRATSSGVSSVPLCIEGAVRATFWSVGVRKRNRPAPRRRRGRCNPGRSLRTGFRARDPARTRRRARVVAGGAGDVQFSG